MKALFVESPGDEPSLVIKEVKIPQLGPYDVLIKVAACGLCHHDVAVMRGTLRRGVKTDVILGHEISGEVVDTGTQVSQVSQGEFVAAYLVEFCGKCERCMTGKEYRCLQGKGVGHAIDGGLAEYVRLNENSVIKVPDGVDPIDASILACPIGVSLQAIRNVANLQTGETVLVTGAGGGLGVHAVQIASSLGARVIAVTTSPHKLELLESLEIGEVFLVDSEDFSEIALALTNDLGVDVVANTVGSAVFRSSIRSLNQFGRMVVLGEIEGERVSINLTEILFRDATVMGSTGASKRHVEDAAKMVSDEMVKPIISRQFSLEDTLEAYRLIRDKKSFGRIVIVP